jgi:hypothetical protein
MEMKKPCICTNDHAAEVVSLFEDNQVTAVSLHLRDGRSVIEIYFGADRKRAQVDVVSLPRLIAILQHFAMTAAHRGLIPATALARYRSTATYYAAKVRGDTEQIGKTLVAMQTNGAGTRH